MKRTSFLLSISFSVLLVSCDSRPDAIVGAELNSVRPSYSVSIADFGAVPNDGVPDDDAIQAAIRASDDVYIPAGVWDFARTDTIISRRRIHGSGAESIINVIPSCTHAFVESGQTDVTVDSLAFRTDSVCTRTDAGPSFGFGLVASGGSQIRFRYNTATRLSVFYGVDATDVEVTRNTGHAAIQSQVGGIVLVNVRRGTVRSNSLSEYEEAIELWGGESDPTKASYSTDHLVGDLTIDDNTISHVGAGVFMSNAENVQVTGNTVINCEDICLDAEGSINITFRNNTAKYAATAVLAVWQGSHDVHFTDNYIEQDGAARWPNIPGPVTRHYDSTVPPVDVGTALFDTRNFWGGPHGITVDLVGNTFAWSGSSGVGTVMKVSSDSVLVAENTFINVVVDMTNNNNGRVVVTDNYFSFSRSINEPAVHVSSNHLGGGEAGGFALIQGNAVCSDVQQFGAPGIEIWQWAWGPVVPSTITDNDVSGFGTSISAVNDNQAHPWMITDNRNDGAIVWDGNWSPSATVYNNGGAVSQFACPQ